MVGWRNIFNWNHFNNKSQIFQNFSPSKKLKGLMKTEGSDHHEIGNNTEKNNQNWDGQLSRNDSGKIVVAFFCFLFLLSLTKIILSLGQTKQTEDRDFCYILFFFVEFKRRTNENKQHDILWLCALHHDDSQLTFLLYKKIRNKTKTKGEFFFFSS